MLIEKITKYLIVDVCVDVFFKKLRENFKSISESDIPKINEFYSKILAKDNSEVFFNCRITDVEHIHDYDDGVDFIIVTFEYDEWYCQDDFDDDDDDDDLTDIGLGNGNKDSDSSAEAILREESDEPPLDISDPDDEDYSDPFNDELGLDCVPFQDYLFIK